MLWLFKLVIIFLYVFFLIFNVLFWILLCFVCKKWDKWLNEGIKFLFSFLICDVFIVCLRLLFIWFWLIYILIILVIVVLILWLSCLNMFFIKKIGRRVIRLEIKIIMNIVCCIKLVRFCVLIVNLIFILEVLLIVNCGWIELNELLIIFVRSGSDFDDWIVIRVLLVWLWRVKFEKIFVLVNVCWIFFVDKLFIVKLLMYELMVSCVFFCVLFIELLKLRVIR